MSPDLQAMPGRAGAGEAALRCTICGRTEIAPAAESLGSARGNTHRFVDARFRLWRCPDCGSIHSIEPVDYDDIHSDYVLKKWKLDYFSKTAYGNLLGRLRKAGWRPGQTILDVGAGSGVFLNYLKSRGIDSAVGYDPYAPPFNTPPPADAAFDCVVANDVIEHCEDPRAFLAHYAARVKPGGLLYVSTVDAGPVRLDRTDEHLMCLHQPFHRVMFKEETFLRLCRETGMEMVATFRRSYMDTMWPFVNRRFLGEFNRALGDNVDKTFEPAAQKIVGRRPRLWFFGFFGYFFPSDFEPAAILRKPRKD